MPRAHKNPLDDFTFTRLYTFDWREGKPHSEWKYIEEKDLTMQQRIEISKDWNRRGLESIGYKILDEQPPAQSATHTNKHSGT